MGQGSRALVPMSKPKTRRQRWRLHWSSQQTDFQKNLGSQRDRKKAPRPGSCLRLRRERSRGLRLPPLLPHAGLPATPEWPSPELWMRKRGPGRRRQDREPREPGMPRRAHNDTQWVSRGTWGPHGFGGKGHTLACVYSPKISQAWACPDLEPRRPLFPAASPNMHLNFSTRCSSASCPLSPGSELPAQGDQATPISASPAPKTGPGFKRCPINAGSAHSPVTPTPGILQHFLCLFELVAFFTFRNKKSWKRNHSKTPFR